MPHVGPLRIFVRPNPFKADAALRLRVFDYNFRLPHDDCSTFFPSRLSLGPLSLLKKNTT